jgi:endonuclease YncB( thermonuclease family)
MKRRQRFKTSMEALVIAGLIFGTLAAAPPKPGPKASLKVGSVSSAQRLRKPPVRPFRRRILKPIPGRAIPGPLGRRFVVPLYRRRVVVRRVRPSVVVRTVRDLAVVPAATIAESEEAYRVAGVDDDYAVRVVIDGQETAVRMLGVEPPLVAASEGESAALPDGVLQFVRNLLVDEFVYLGGDPNLADEDAEGKRVAYLYRAPDKLLVNLELIRQGYGLVPEGYSFAHQDAFTFYQQKAQADGKGIWATLPVAPE